MTRFKKENRKLANTFRNARKGMRLTIKSEKNIRIHLFVATIVIICAYCLDFSITRFCILLLTISAVITAEMFNSAIEFALDATFHNKYSIMVGMAKDIAAGAVLVTTIMAIMIGVLLFVPPIYNILAN